ncbi:MAG TPA: hypothetical protein VGJ45_25430 [Pseudonocardiaceae bacterium]
MSEFDLDPQIRGAAGFGWDAHAPSTVGESDVVVIAGQGYQRLT